MKEQGGNRKKKRKSAGYFLIWVLLFCIILGIGGVGLYIYLPSFEQGSVYEYDEWSPNRINITLQDTPVASETAPFYEDGLLYIPVDFIKEYIDPYVFWDDQTNKVTITTADKVIRMPTDTLDYLINDNPFTLSAPLYQGEGMAYIPYDFLNSFYQLDIKYKEQSQVVVIDFLTEQRNVAPVIKNTPLRFEGDKKSPYLDKLEKGVTVYVFDEVIEETGYVKVRTEDGYIGYVKLSALGSVAALEQVAQTKELVEAPWRPQSGKLMMVWDQVGNIQANLNANRRLTHEGLDILSPTWFTLADTEGNITSIAETTYVEWAHSNGYQVWALFSNNFTSPDCAEITHEVLSNTDKREFVIKQLLAYVSLYDLDGINIDFEDVPSADGENFVQFVRELTPYLRQQGVTVSVDVYVPYPHTEHYNRNALGETVDYFMIMGYDEHWGTSPTAGSVASIGWVETGVKNTINQGVPPEKIVLGIPFYTRLWKIENGQVSSTAMGIENGYQTIVENASEIVWDEDAGQFYGEYTENDIQYRMWLEEEISLQLKAALVDKYGLAGVAGWRRGLEREATWQMLKEELK